eukprot:GGOE01000192.1.p2 GENE.GGOE01000192.1~~GGOE01000192.1.p2  ORF type:complete len:116 (+),score=24.01 GGOE01000192.1:171-518(+)
MKQAEVRNSFASPCITLHHRWCLTWMEYSAASFLTVFRTGSGHWNTAQAVNISSSVPVWQPWNSPARGINNVDEETEEPQSGPKHWEGDNPSMERDFAGSKDAVRSASGDPIRAV